jgi:hypothetical protein
MWKLRVFALTALVMCSCTPGRSDAGSLESLFRSILADTDGSRLPKEEAVGVQFSRDMHTLTPSEIKGLLPLAQQCLVSKQRLVRGYGVTFFALAALRTDSSQLLVPYIDDIAPLLDDPDPSIRNGAIYALGSSKPRPPLRGIAYLDAHLRDQSNTADQFNMIVGALVAESVDSATIHKVIAAVRQRSDVDNVRGRFIEILGISGTRAEEAMSFIRAGLMDTNSAVRATSIEAVSKMPRDIRVVFANELNAIASNPAITPQQRDRARQVITQ